MLRIVKDFVDHPSLFLLCDNKHCSTAITFTPDPSMDVEIEQVVMPFAQQALEMGWVVAIDQHLCPNHVKKMQEGRKLVQVPTYSLSKQ